MPVIGATEPHAKRERPTEYYQYVVECSPDLGNFVSLLDMASPLHTEVHTLLQQCMALDEVNDTRHAAHMLAALIQADMEQYDAEPFRTELEALVARTKTERWESPLTFEKAAQGQRGIVYYLFDD